MPALAVVLNSIRVDNDHDGWGKGAGDIYLNYNTNDGVNHVNGRLGEYSIDSGDTRSLGVTVGYFDDVDDLVSLNVDVWDADWPDGDDYLGSLNVSFGAAENFGVGSHSVDVGDFMLKYSIVEI
jgi:hypothetical protein